MTSGEFKLKAEFTCTGQIDDFHMMSNDAKTYGGMRYEEGQRAEREFTRNYILAVVKDLNCGCRDDPALSCVRCRVENYFEGKAKEGQP